MAQGKRRDHDRLAPAEVPGRPFGHLGVHRSDQHIGLRKIMCGHQAVYRQGIPAGIEHPHLRHQTLPGERIERHAYPHVKSQGHVGIGQAPGRGFPYQRIGPIEVKRQEHIHPQCPATFNWLAWCREKASLPCRQGSSGAGGNPVSWSSGTSSCGCWTGGSERRSVCGATDEDLSCGLATGGTCSAGAVSGAPITGMRSVIPILSTEVFSSGLYSLS